MNYKKLQVIAFLGLLLLSLVVVALVLQPFFNVIALAIIVVLLCWPLYKKLLHRFKSETMAATLTVLIIFLCIFIPIALFGQLVFSEIVNFYHGFKSGTFILNRADIMQGLPSQAQELITTISQDVNSWLGGITGNAFQAFSSLISNIAGFFISVFLLFFTIFYVLKDGERIKKVLMDISPIASSQERILGEKIMLAVNGVVKGSFLVALSQAIVATCGFFIFGVPNPILWGIFTFLAALVPTVGTSLSLIPAVAYLFVTNHVSAAVGLGVWAFLAVGLIDNVLGPKLVSAKTQLHPLLVLFSVVGGLQFFGFLGFLLGPILMAIFVALIDMYRTDFKAYLEN